MSIHHDPDRTSRMCALFNRGIPVATISAQFEVHPPAVYKALRRGGILPAYASRSRPEAVSETTKASLAERVANGGSVKQWCRETGTGESESRRVWRAICRDLGRQAQ
jgi:hypothetical protein